MNNLEAHFLKFRNNIIGIDKQFETPYGNKKIIYADWTASGRLYFPIENKIVKEIAPFVANTHTETSVTGSSITYAYGKARSIIKEHVNASCDDVLITVGTGMTGAINKLQRILGLKIPENLKAHTIIPEYLRTIVFVSHMEHHSNQTSWLETIATVKVIPEKNGLICMESLERMFEEFKHFQTKIVAITACSNVTGIITNYYKAAKIAHSNGGLCFVDFACSAPYVKIDMHPKNADEYLDAITFSPHKFLGGPGSSGVLIFNKKLHKNLVPDNPGGGTVIYTNPWGDHDYIDDIEIKEDGGTPGFLQVIKIAMAIKLKEEMGVDNILNREHELITALFTKLKKIKNLHILAENHPNRLGIFSFYIDNAHYSLIAKILNDRFGIQARGGCSCAGTYGHYLLNINEETSKSIEQKIKNGCLIDRPGWVRISIHPTTTNNEIDIICEAIQKICANFQIWKNDYQYDFLNNKFVSINHDDIIQPIVKNWFQIN